VKFLFDHNLSYRLVASLADLYPGSAHVRDVGLHTALDEAVWRHASQQGFVLVSKDTDFYQRSLVFGPPPKVIWIRLGNCSTDDVAALLRTRHKDLLAFDEDEDVSFLALS
jgi:predicted nuclease of predicted toxin-antitoxin system